MSAYRADLGELDAVIARLETLVARTRESAEDVSARVASLASSWDGSAAEAHRAAHTAWAAGAAEMAAGVDAMKGAVHRARSMYGAAIEANMRMFGTP